MIITDSTVTDAGGNSTSNNLYVSATTSQVSDIWELEFKLNSFDLTGSNHANGYVGVSLRDGTITTGSEAEVGLIRIIGAGASANAPTNLRIQTRMNSVNDNLFDYSGLSLDNLTIRAVINTATDKMTVYATDDNVDLGSGVGMEHNFGEESIPATGNKSGTQTAKVVNEIRFISQQWAGNAMYDQWPSAAEASFDYIRVRTIPEPTASFLLGLGSLVLLSSRRRA